VAAIAVAFGVLVIFPSGARAQSAIAGVVKDATGAVIPGVTVEASSDVLIEKVRTATSDGQGQYQIIDLRPGAYVVTFTLPGFNTVRREGVELPAAFTATINAEMRIGALEETVVVSGQSPTVDIHSTSTTQVVPRAVWDTLPTARNVQAVAQLMPGIRMDVSDVGGSQAMQQQRFLVRGVGGGQNTVLFDDLNLNSLLGDGATVPYFNDAVVQEFSFQAGGLEADTEAGGGRLNVIPKDGGNRFGASGFAAWMPVSWQGDNFSQELKDLGLRSSGGITKMFDVNGGLGGPLKQDRIWFYVAGRDYAVNNQIPDTFFRDGSPAIDDQYIKLALARITTQLTPRNKLSVHYDRMYKWRGHRFEPPTIFIEPEVSSRIHDNPLYYWSTVKWTSTVSSKLLVEGGYVMYINPNRIMYQPGVRKDPFTPEWYAQASRFDRDRNTISTAAQVSTRSIPERFSWQGAVSYVTGSHHFKVGGDWHWGRQRSMSEANADLQQEYRSGVPESAVIYNTPIFFTDSLLNADAALFAQDSWRFRRLTLMGGARYQYYDASIPEQSSGGGRFVGLRRFDPIEHVPTFKDWAPRFGAVYDLFGDAKTAVKFNISRYVEQRTLSLTTPYNPLSMTTARVPWTDVNRDSIAQGELGCVYLTPGCELNLASLPQNFGIRVLNTQDSNLKRPGNTETSLAVQHELLPRVSVGVGWYRRSFLNFLQTDHIDRSQADYSPLTVVSPLDGEVISVYNLAPSKLSLTRRLDTNATSDRQQVYNGFEFAMTARLPGGTTIFGGTSHQRTLSVTCDQPDDKNLLRFCDQRESGIPFQTDAKLNVSYPVPFFGLQLSGVLQATQGKPTGTDWLLSRTTRYAGNCPGPCTPGALVIPTLTETSLTVPLVAPGTMFLDRFNQLDIRIGKRFDVKKAKMSAQIDFFNALNANPVEIVRSTNFGTTAYQLPATILQARIVKLSAQVNWWR
jgi:hypothetical protein